MVGLWTVKQQLEYYYHYYYFYYFNLVYTGCLKKLVPQQQRENLSADTKHNT